MRFCSNSSSESSPSSMEAGERCWPSGDDDLDLATGAGGGLRDRDLAAFLDFLLFLLFELIDCKYSSSSLTGDMPPPVGGAASLLT